MVNPAHISTCPWRDDLRCKATHRVCVQFPCLMVKCGEHQKFFPHFFTFAFLDVLSPSMPVMNQKSSARKCGAENPERLDFFFAGFWLTLALACTERWEFKILSLDLLADVTGSESCQSSTGHGSRFSKNRDRQTDTHTHTHVLVHVHTHIHIHMHYISICICIYTHYIIYMSILSYPILSYPIYPIYPIYQPINLSMYQSI